MTGPRWPRRPDHTTRRGGRAVRYPGVEHLTGTPTVADLLARSAIHTITLIGGDGTRPAPDALVDTRDFVRPQWSDGGTHAGRHARTRWPDHSVRGTQPHPLLRRTLTTATLLRADGRLDSGHGHGDEAEAAA
jgi:hypothetical protein